MQKHDDMDKLHFFPWWLYKRNMHSIGNDFECISGRLCAN